MRELGDRRSRHSRWLCVQVILLLSALAGDTRDNTLTQVEVNDSKSHKVQSPALHSIGGNEGMDMCTLFDLCREEFWVQSLITTLTNKRISS